MGFISLTQTLTHSTVLAVASRHAAPLVGSQTVHNCDRTLQVIRIYDTLTPVPVHHPNAIGAGGRNEWSGFPVSRRPLIHVSDFACLSCSNAPRARARARTHFVCKAWRIRSLLLINAHFTSIMSAPASARHAPCARRRFAVRACSSERVRASVRVRTNHKQPCCSPARLTWWGKITESAGICRGGGGVGGKRV